MRDIVATIQPDQDDIVRAPLTESICVQGAPGTGKTAVGLHRAAYLLYTHSGQLARSGVLVVGPNRAFLRYIEQVLPTLGEVDVEQTTVAQLTARVPVRAVDPPQVAVLKGDARMAEVLRRALWGEIAKPADSIQVTLTGRRYRIPVERLKRYVDDLRRRARADDDQQLRPLRRRPGAARDAARRGRPPAEGGGRRQPQRRRDAARGAQPRGPRLLRRRLAGPRRRPGWCTRCSPTPPGSARAARGLLDDEEQALLRWDPAPRSVRTAPWTEADAVLVDEAAGLLERTEGYGHVVLDEAQDLSPMQCRSVARRLAAGSLTVLGDLAQATSPWSPSDWRETLAGLGRPGTVVRPLTRGYRVPGEVLDYANRLLPAIAPDLPPATAVRSEPGSLTVRPVTALAEPLTEVVADLAATPGSIGIVCADAAVDEVVGAAGRRRPARRRRSPTTARRRPAWPSSPRPWPRAWSSTPSSWSTPPRSWPPSRAACTGSTSSSPARSARSSSCTAGTSRRPSLGRTWPEVARVAPSSDVGGPPA